MSDSEVGKLKADLKELEDEVPKMEMMLKQLDDLLALNKSFSTKSMLIERREQLSKDIENYQHMLEEANDLKKSWNFTEHEMQFLNPLRSFPENSNTFDGIIDVSATSVDKAHVAHKELRDRVPFTSYGEQGGVVEHLPIVFDFGLLKQHQMGGWETSDDEEEFFSFTFKWSDDLFQEENPKLPVTFLDTLKIKATSIVILYDDRTSRIVSFDVEPGFEHQWGYGRQRFMAKKTLSEKCDQARFRAIIKEWSEQHQYEMGKYTIELLRQVKNQSVEATELIQFIAKQTEEEIQHKEEIAKLELQMEEVKLEKSRLEEELNKLKNEVSKLQEEVESKSVQVEELQTELQVKEQELTQSVVKETFQHPGTDSAQITRPIDWETVVKDLKATILELENKLKAEEESRQEKEAQLEKIKEKCKETCSKIEKLTEDRDMLQAKIAELEENIEKLIKLLEKQSQENGDLKSQVGNLGAEVEKERGDKVVLEKNNKDILCKLETANEQLLGKDAEIDEKQKQISSLQTNLNKAEKEVGVANRKYLRNRNRLADRNAQLVDAVKRAREAIKALQPVADIDLSTIDNLEKVDVPESDSEDEDVKISDTKGVISNESSKSSTSSDEDDNEMVIETIVTCEPVENDEIIQANRLPSEAGPIVPVEEVVVAEPIPEVAETNGVVDETEPDPVEPPQEPEKITTEPVKTEKPTDDVIEAEPIDTTVESGTTKPETPKPETPEPATTETETVEPETTEPVTSEPETTEPVTSEPESPEPAISEPPKETSDPVGSDSSPLEIREFHGDDYIQAIRVATPVFFPPKEEETQSIQSSSSTKSPKTSTSPHIKAPTQSKAMNKFDLSMGVKKNPKKPSGLKKFINMCTGKSSSSKTPAENIEESNEGKQSPQSTLPRSPKK